MAGHADRRWVALLRAVNVGGRGVVKMADVRQAFESVDCRNVTTYVQSGNVVFDASDARSARAALARRIEDGLEHHCGVRSTPFLLSPEELRAAAQGNPFDPQRHAARQQCHVVFLSGRPARSHIDTLLAAQGDDYRFAVDGAVCYMTYARDTAGRRRAVDIERILGVSATARTWKVVDALVDLAER